MLKKGKKINANNLMLVLFFSIYPILPDYFRILSRPVYVIVAIVVTVWMAVFHLSKKRFKMKSDSITLVVLIYIIFTLIPIGFSTGLMSSLINFFKLAAPIIVTLDFARTEEKWNKIIDVVIATSVPIILLSYIEIFGFNIFSLIENYDLDVMGTSAYSRMGMFRLESSFGHSIPYAICLSSPCWCNIKYFQITPKKVL